MTQPASWESPAEDETRERKAGWFKNVIDQLTEDEATELLLWLAKNKPDAFRSALRTAVSWAPRIHALYRAEGRPHS
jgi:dsDNA-binding SOS-regulon protein